MIKYFALATSTTKQPSCHKKPATGLNIEKLTIPVKNGNLATISLIDLDAHIYVNISNKQHMQYVRSYLPGCETMSFCRWL
jgi:hypothetical protein